MLDNEKLEKVIQALRCRSRADQRYENPCVEIGMCPYARQVVDGSGELIYPFVCDKKQIFEDTIALLKVQLAHIIPKDELTQRMKTPVWLETKNGKVYTGWALTYDVQKGMGITGTRMGITDPSGRVHWLNLEDYGRTWRCWTSEPTEEQRKAAEWQ